MQTQLRAQIVNSLKRDHVVSLAPQRVGTQGSLRHTALNHMISGYMDASQMSFSLAVFREEANIGQTHALSESDLMQVLHIAPGSFMHTAIKAKGKSWACVFAWLWLINWLLK